jgi:hypothetical protein
MGVGSTPLYPEGWAKRPLNDRLNSEGAKVAKFLGI